MRPTLCVLASIAKSSSKPKSRPGDKPAPLSLDHFLQRQRVIHLYRDIVRSLYRHTISPQREESVAYAKGEFMRNKDVKEVEQVRYLISTGKAEWDGMRRGIEDLGPVKRRRR